MIAAVRGSDDDIWLLDLTRGIPTRLTFGTENAWPVWAPDGKRFVWKSDRNGAFNLYLSSLDNPSTVERLTTSSSLQTPGSWTPDGGQILYAQEDGTTRGDIWAIDINSRKTREIVKTAFDERLPALSPNGRWLAYVSDESGRRQVVVQPFPGPGPKRQVSDSTRVGRPSLTRRGDVPLRWSRDGRELFYLDDDRLMAVTMRFEKGLDSDAPRSLFARADMGSFDVSSDGRRFLIHEIAKRVAQTRISLALGAASEIGEPQRAQERR